MSEGNGNGMGALVLGRHGMLRVQYSDEVDPATGQPKYPVVSLDVVHVANQWADVDRSLRDENGKVPPERLGDWNMACWQFAKEALQAPDLSMADALHFQKVITDEGMKLRRFFEPASSEEPSSREGTELTFSE
jgi:hypothetical protein